MKIFKTVPKIFCTLEDWGSKKERIKISKKRGDYELQIEFNKRIEKIELKVQNIIRHILLNDINPTENFILEKLDSESFKVKNSFFDVYNEFLEKNKINYTAGTLKTHKNCFNFIKKFENYNGLIQFANIDLKFFDQLKEYAFINQKLKNNYFATLLRRFKTFLTWANKRRYHQNLIYKDLPHQKKTSRATTYLIINLKPVYYGRRNLSVYEKRNSYVTVSYGVYSIRSIYIFFL